MAAARGPPSWPRYRADYHEELSTTILNAPGCARGVGRALLLALLDPLWLWAHAVDEALHEPADPDTVRNALERACSE